ncbi:MAG: Amuc_1099 family pilus-like system protein [Verrucomicrobiota bacterium]
MKSLKQHMHWLALSVIAVGSIAATALLVKVEQDLPGELEKLRPKQPKAKKLPPLDLSGLEAATQALKTPAQWGATYNTLLFVSEPYLMGANGLERPKEGSLHRHSKTGEPIPNSWFLSNKLPLRTPKVPTDDTDGDGFTNEEEWKAGTNPQDSNSHPPLITKLNFTELKEAHSRVSFVQYLGNPAQPESVMLTIQLLDLPNKPQLEKKVGDVIPNTSLKILAFTGRKNENTGIKGFTVDASVIRLLDEKTGQEAAAELKGNAADFLDKTITLNLVYPKENRTIVTKPGQRIILSDSEIYTVVDSTASSAVLKDAAGAEIEVKAGASN